MPDGADGMVQQHPRAGITHHLSNPLPHLAFITMNRTLLAGGFPLSELAGVQPPMGIRQQFPATRAQVLVALLFPAIKPYHLLHHSLFPFNACHSFPFHFQSRRYGLISKFPPEKNIFSSRGREKNVARTLKQSPEEVRTKSRGNLECVGREKMGCRCSAPPHPFTHTRILAHARKAHNKNIV